MEAEKNKLVDEMARNTEGVSIHKPNYMLMSLQRIFVIIVILAGVIVVVYYTPMPGISELLNSPKVAFNRIRHTCKQTLTANLCKETSLKSDGIQSLCRLLPDSIEKEYFENCDRECHELDWPMICRVKLVIEVYKTLSKSCGNCVETGGECPQTCISADGRERGVLSINRNLPAPAFHVCQNDILVVDVVHRAPAHALSIHWRGQPQKETPFMDGVPMLTQCPQPAYTTFQYKFRASQAGTHMYHAHSAADTADGLAGGFIVRQSPRLDPLKKLYDVDVTDHTIFISEWGHSMGPLAGMTSSVLDAESLLINGKGKTAESFEAPLANFKVEYGKRYRFRLAYSGGTKSCPVNFSVKDHVLELIALDGHNIKTELVSSIELARGERADFVLTSNVVPGVYKMDVVADESCQKNLVGEAELVYEDNKEKMLHPDSDSNPAVSREFTTLTSEKCKSDHVLCLGEIQSETKLESNLAVTVDTTLYVPFNYSTRRISAKRVESWGQTDGHRFTYPASPLLTQQGDVTPDTLCSEEAGQGEECVHVKTVDLGSTVELIMFDQGGESDHIFHLHGYSFHVVSVRKFNQSLNKDDVIKMNEAGTLFEHKNLINPVVKDTIDIPKFGVVALRFKADNPGYWLMRDERSSHWTRGLDFILKVGKDKDFVQAPLDFPKCGSYVGPEYFLI